MGKDSSLQMTKFPWTEAQCESIQDPKEEKKKILRKGEILWCLIVNLI